MNFSKLLNVKDYWIGKVNFYLFQTLPAHISPFVNENDEQRYIPDREKELRGMETSPEQNFISKAPENTSGYDIIE